MGALLEFTSANLSFEAQERFGGIMSIIAVVFVTWMIFWMRTAARTIAKELQGRLDAAVAVGGTAVVVLAFISVAREGLETSRLLLDGRQGDRLDLDPARRLRPRPRHGRGPRGALYRSAVKINLAVFFKWTGFLLIFVAAGVLSYGVHDLQEAGFLPGLNNLLFDVSEQIPPAPGTARCSRVSSTSRRATTVLEAVVWLAYVVRLPLLLPPPGEEGGRTGARLGHA